MTGESKKYQNIHNFPQCLSLCNTWSFLLMYFKGLKVSFFKVFKVIIICIFCSLLLQVQTSRTQVHQELKEREDVEKELGLVKGWIQDTRGLLLSPTADLDSLLQELEVCRNMWLHVVCTQTIKWKRQALLIVWNYEFIAVICIMFVDDTWRSHQQTAERWTHDRASTVQVPGPSVWPSLWDQHAARWSCSGFGFCWRSGNLIKRFVKYSCKSYFSSHYQ